MSSPAKRPLSRQLQQRRVPSPRIAPPPPPPVAAAAPAPLDRFHFLRGLNNQNEVIKACMPLTDEQLKAIEQARSPSAIAEDAQGGRINLLLAAAASGKTTTMLALIEVLHALGHGSRGGTYTLYAVFNANARGDADKRMHKLSAGAKRSVDCRTTHSAAQHCTPELKNNIQFPKNSARREWRCPEMGGGAIEKYVRRVCGDEIREHVMSGSSPPSTDKQRQRDEELCAFWIYKTWLNWVQKVPEYGGRQYGRWRVFTLVGLNRRAASGPSPRPTSMPPPGSAS